LVHQNNPEVAMTAQEILTQLSSPEVAAERLLDRCLAPDFTLWKDHPELYFAFVKRLVEQGHPGRAVELAREGETHLKNHSRLQYQLALAAARGGNPSYAETLLAPLLENAIGPVGSRPADMDTALRVNIIALQARVYKDRSAREPDLTRKSAEWYERAAAVALAAEVPDLTTYPLINAATMWRLAGDQVKSEQLAADVVRQIEPLAEAAAVAGNIWPAATLGEALLLLGRHEDAVKWYSRAIGVANGRGETGNLASIRNNLRRLQAVGATANPDFLDEHLGKVVVFSGHMLDSPDRRQAGHPPRFPNDPRLIQAVATAIRATLDKLNAKVGYCSLACGGDILFAEAMLARGAELHVVLPFSQHDFRRTSVDFGQDGREWRSWRQRFDDILDKVEQESTTRVRYATREPYLGSDELFGFTNSMLQGLAVLRSRERASESTAVALIDRLSEGKTGGTAHFVATWTTAGYVAHEIDLAALRNANSSYEKVNERPAAPAVTGTLNRPVKAMLFADVAGYSAIDEWELSRFLASYRDYLKAIFASPVGKPAIYANAWGDGLYVVFDHVADAAAFACELVEPTIGVPPDWQAFRLGQTTPFRVGLHAGPVFELADLFQGRSEFTGQHVNRAARIEPVTIRGCAYASEPFAALLILEASTRFVVEAVGVHSLAKEYDRCPLYRLQRALIKT